MLFFLANNLWSKFRFGNTKIIFQMWKSNCPQMFFKIGVFNLWWRLFLIKLQASDVLLLGTPFFKADNKHVLVSLLFALKIYRTFMSVSSVKPLSYFSVLLVFKVNGTTDIGILEWRFYQMTEKGNKTI